MHILSIFQIIQYCTYFSFLYCTFAGVTAVVALVQYFDGIGSSNHSSSIKFQDRRGQHSPKNKTQEEDMNFACCHIRSFPFECHNRPDGTSVLYLPHDLNVQKMYEMYKAQCTQAGRTAIGSFVYRKILKERWVVPRDVTLFAEVKEGQKCLPQLRKMNTTNFSISCTVL